MLNEPRITSLTIESLGLVELSPDLDPGATAETYLIDAFMVVSSPSATSWWLPERSFDGFRDLVKELRSGQQTIRTVSDLAGVTVGIERLDHWPDLGSRLASKFADAGGHMSAYQGTMNELRLVVNGLFARGRNLDSIVRSVCYRAC